MKKNPYRIQLLLTFRQVTYYKCNYPCLQSSYVKIPLFLLKYGWHELTFSNTRNNHKKICFILSPCQFNVFFYNILFHISSIKEMFLRIIFSKGKKSFIIMIQGDDIKLACLQQIWSLFVRNE